jgi:hypothetical protein
MTQYTPHPALSFMEVLWTKEGVKRTAKFKSSPLERI